MTVVTPEALTSEALTSARVCFFAHYDSDGQVDAYVLGYLQALRELGFSVVFVTTAVLTEEALAAVRALADEVIVRENTGHDFGSWAEAYARLGDRIEGVLLLANDSVYGPLGELGPLLNDLLARPEDFFGLVESHDKAPHLQSWFLLFKPHVHRSKVFRSIMRLPFATFDKGEIIRRGEVGLSVALRNAGFRSRAAWQGGGLAWLGRVCPYNPAHWLWRQLLESRRVPFIKVELLRDNPTDVPGLDAWRAITGQFCPEAVPLIEGHLARKRAAALGPSPAPGRFMGVAGAAQALLVRAHENAARGRTTQATMQAAGFAGLWTLMRIVRKVGGARRSLRTLANGGG